MMNNVKISDVCHINPLSHRSKNVNPNILVSFVPMAAVSEISGTIEREEERTLAQVASGFTTFRNGDIIVAKITPCFENAKIALVQVKHEYAFGSTEFHVVRPYADNLNSRYAFHFLRLPKVRKEGEREMTGSAGQKRLPASYLETLRMPLPPLEEQARIVEILDTADAAIRVLDDLIAAKIRHKHAQAERLLSGKCRFPEFKQEAWRTYTLGELFTERVECNRLDLKLLAVTGNDGIVVRDTLAKRDTSSEDKSKYLRVAPGDIAYNTMRMWQGVLGLSAHEGIVSPAYTVCVPNKEIDAQFAAHLFKTPAMIARFRRYSQGLVDDTLNLKFPAFAKIEATVPSLPEQRRIADTLDLMEQEIRLLRRQRERQQQMKHGLMQQLLTGNRRVKEVAP